MKIRNTSFAPLCFSGVFENHKERFYHSINAIEHSFDSQYIFLFIGLICLYTCLCLCLSFCLDYIFVLLNFWTLGLQKNTKLLFSMKIRNTSFTPLCFSGVFENYYLKSTKQESIVQLLLSLIPLFLI